MAESDTLKFRTGIFEPCGLLPAVVKLLSESRGNPLKMLTKILSCNSVQDSDDATTDLWILVSLTRILRPRHGLEVTDSAVETIPCPKTNRRVFASSPGCSESSIASDTRPENRI